MVFFSSNLNSVLPHNRFLASLRMLVLTTFCLAGCAAEPIVEVLPQLKDIAKIEVLELYNEDGKTLESFLVSNEKWEELLKTLVPSRVDTEPAKWLVMGGMNIETTTGKKVEVHLYHTADEVGAFSIQKKEHERLYFRGGNSEALSKVLHKAYLAREEK